MIVLVGLMVGGIGRGSGRGSIRNDIVVCLVTVNTRRNAEHRQPIRSKASAEDGRVVNWVVLCSHLNLIAPRTN